jgi:hypothetical protein
MVMSRRRSPMERIMCVHEDKGDWEKGVGVGPG